jgi:ribosomal protein S12 methylthiotransferase
VKRERMERLLELQRSITAERAEGWVGREAEILIDRVVGRESAMRGGDVRGAVGRTVGQAPEVDGVVHVREVDGITPGDLVRVRITAALEEDLEGELLS